MIYRLTQQYSHFFKHGGLTAIVYSSLSHIMTKHGEERPQTNIGAEEWVP